MPRLTDLFNNDDTKKAAISKAFDSATAAGDFEPLPAGVYVAHVINGELTNAKSGTAGYKLTFRIIEGEHANRQFWHDIWLTPAAIPMAKRDLGKLGITKLEQLENPLPVGIRCECQLVKRKSDDGTEYNRVRRFDVVGIDADPTADDEFADDTAETEGGES